MPDQPAEWTDYQISVDPSVPNPMAGPPDGGAPARRHGDELRLTVLGGVAPVSWRRVLALLFALMAAWALVAGLLLPWSFTVYVEVPFHTNASFWEDSPLACSLMVVTGMVSLVLLVARYGRMVVTLLNFFAGLVLLFASLMTLQEGNGISVRHVMGPAQLAVAASLTLNIVASLLQPPRDA
jgi:hypothetical protein